MTVAKGTVHDLGYKRYVGTRRPQSTRWRVIARNVMRQSWKGFWRFKLPLLLVVINTAVFVILMTNHLISELGNRVMADPEDVLLVASYSGIGFLCRSTFIASLLIAAPAVAQDAQSGAFAFYFARPVRPLDYVAGKLAGYWLLFAFLLIGAPLILAGTRLGMYGSASEALHHLDLLPKVILIGALGALAYAAVPLAISSLVPNRRYAFGLWATYYVVFGLMLQGIGFRGNSPWLAMLDISSAITTMAQHLFHVTFLGRSVASLTEAIIGISVHAAAAIAILYYRVSRARMSGIGGTG
jgi:ABC-type transport system involved in multi-copper enzyme maturation permease subunit